MVAVQVSFAPNRELYDAVAQKVQVVENKPGGLIVHTANELPDGRIQIVDVYDSMESLAAFGETRVMPAFEAVGVPQQIIEASRPTAYEAFEVARA